MRLNLEYGFARRKDFLDSKKRRELECLKYSPLDLLVCSDCLNKNKK